MRRSVGMFSNVFSGDNRRENLESGSDCRVHNHKWFESLLTFLFYFQKRHINQNINKNRGNSPRLVWMFVSFIEIPAMCDFKDNVDAFAFNDGFAMVCI